MSTEDEDIKLLRYNGYTEVQLGVVNVESVAEVLRVIQATNVSIEKAKKATAEAKEEEARQAQLPPPFETMKAAYTHMANIGPVAFVKRPGRFYGWVDDQLVEIPTGARPMRVQASDLRPVDLESVQDETDAFKVLEVVNGLDQDAARHGVTISAELICGRPFIVATVEGRQYMIGTKEHPDTRAFSVGKHDSLGERADVETNSIDAVYRIRDFS